MLLDTPTMMIVAEGDNLTMWQRRMPGSNEIGTATKKRFVQASATHISMYSNLSSLEPSPLGRRSIDGRVAGAASSGGQGVIC